MNTVIIETVVTIVANLAITLIGVFGAWLLTRISKHTQLSTINEAVREAITAAETTTLELQQTVVEGLKAAHADGKLTQDEIKELGVRLLAGAMTKMSRSGIEVLKAAKVDLSAIIRGAGEAMLTEMKVG